MGRDEVKERLYAIGVKKGEGRGRDGGKGS